MTKGFVLGFEVTSVWVASVGSVVCSEYVSNNSCRDTGFPHALGNNGRGNSRLHFRDSNVLEIHTPFSNQLAYLLSSTPGLPEGVFGRGKTTMAVSMLGSVRICIEISKCKHLSVSSSMSD